MPTPPVRAPVCICNKWQWYLINVVDAIYIRRQRLRTVYYSYSPASTTPIRRRDRPRTPASTTPTPGLRHGTGSEYQFRVPQRTWLRYQYPVHMY